jgi:sodium/proline symporter
MFCALVVVLIGSITMAGGVENTAAFLSDIPGYLSMTTTAVPMLDANKTQVVQNGMPIFDVPAKYGLLTIISTASWGLGYFGMPQILVRFMGIRSEELVKTSRRIAIVWMIISMICAVCIGFIGRAVLPTQFGTEATAETVFIVLSRMIFPAFFCGLVVSGILAASMSSASSYLLITGSSVAENIYRGVFKRDATDKQVLMVSRITLLVVLLLGIAIAWDENSVIFTVVSYAWAGLGASFGPLTLFSLYWRRTNKTGAIAGMITGAATVLIWHNLIKPLGGVFGIYELLPAFLLSCLAIYIGSKVTAPPEQAVLDDFDRYKYELKHNQEAVLEEKTEEATA